MIHVESLQVVFGSTPALIDVDLELGPGAHGLFGPNGSGKSTLLRVLAGLLPPTSGRVTWDDSAVSSSAESFRRRVGYAGHLSGLYGRLTVAENLDLFARLYGVAPATIERFSASMNLVDELNKPVRQLSAGLKRRVAVARALLHDPDLLLLDEPYANLDDDAAELVSRAVREWRTSSRIAVIATHGAKRVKGWVDGGVVLRRGRVATAGLYRTAEHPSGGTR